jgi:hypothetical protein
MLESKADQKLMELYEQQKEYKKENGHMAVSTSKVTFCESRYGC